ncbi:Tubulin polyglutamylase ttll4 [Bulinus truncatus]|nr:Tubulin polyglutamylase ttll4 [Bulinus truncatus]
MNSDVSRMVLNRERVLCDDLLNPLKGSTGSDDVTVKKQLPLRQQASRPTLRTNGLGINSNNSFKQEDTLVYSSNNTGKIISSCQISDNEKCDTSVQSLARCKRLSSFSNPFSKPITALDVKNIFDEKNDSKSPLTAYVIPENSQQSFKRNIFLRPVNNHTSKNAECQNVTDSNILQFQSISQNDSTSVEKIYLKRKVLETMFYFASTTPLSTTELLIHNSNINDKIQPSNTSYSVSNLPMQTKEDSKLSTIFKSQVVDSNDIRKNADISCDSSIDGVPVTYSNVDHILTSQHESIKANTGEDGSANYSSVRKLSGINALTGTNDYEKNSHNDRSLSNRNYAETDEKIDQFYQQEKCNQNVEAIDRMPQLGSSLTYSNLFSERSDSANQQQMKQTVPNSAPQQATVFYKDSNMTNQQQIRTLSHNNNSNQHERKQSVEASNFYQQQIKPLLKDKDNPKLLTKDDVLSNEQQIKFLQDQLKLKSDTSISRQNVKQLSVETTVNTKKQSTFLHHTKSSSKDAVNYYSQQTVPFSNDHVQYGSFRKFNSEFQKLSLKDQNAVALQQSKNSAKGVSTNNNSHLQQSAIETNYRLQQQKSANSHSSAKLDHSKFSKKEPISEQKMVGLKQTNSENQQRVFVSNDKVTQAAASSNLVRSDSTTLILKLAQEHKKESSNANSFDSKKSKQFSITKVKSDPNAYEDLSKRENALTEKRPVSAKTTSHESKNAKGVSVKNHQVVKTNTDKANISDNEHLTDSELEQTGEFSLSEERQLGDGESSEDTGEEEALESYHEDYSSDAGSESYSTNSTSSSSKAAIEDSLSMAKEIKQSSTLPSSSSSSSAVIKPAFIFSIFKNIPPTLNFVSEGEKTEQLPWDLRKLMKWKLSPITPIVVKSAIARIGFKITKKNCDWMGCFGKHMKAQCFRQLKNFQKLNHFPGSFNIGRKDRLWRNLSRMQAHFGKKEFSFFPQTFILPSDTKLLKRMWDEGNGKQKWIVKPPASARGQGIRVISKWSQIPRRRPVIVQKYIHHPYLINGSKFDMRIYVYVSSYDPLRLYVYNDGLARFASCKYSSSTKSLSNRFIHLTNYSVNKKNTQYLSNSNTTVCEGHKWSLKALWEYLKAQGINTTSVWSNIKDLIIKTIISGDSAINSTTKANVHCRYSCHELFGFDILLDEHCKPWILEVNISPSLHSNSKLDVDIKSGLIKDMMNIAGLRLPDAKDTHAHSSTSEVDFSNYIPPNKFCMDKRLFTNQLSQDERSKHAYYCQKFQDEQPYMSLLEVNKNSIVEAFVLKHHIEVLQSILDVITPNDLRHLCESIDEDSRKGNFQRLFPTPQTHNYLRYFEQPRYYNLLLDQWVLRYNHMEQKGILLLQSLCEENIHLENPTSNSKHQWSIPNSQMLKSSDFKSSFTSGNVKSSQSLNDTNQSDVRQASAPTLPSIVKKKLISTSSISSLMSSSSSPALYTNSSSVSSATPSR